MKFSVIIPAHNAEDRLEKCLQSVRTQEYLDYELIVVCDACTDRTEDVARKYADKVIVTDYGLDGLARQDGIDAAEGDWIMFLDDDDWWTHEFVLNITAQLTPLVDIVAFDFIWKGVGYASQSEKTVFPAVWSKAWRKSFLTDNGIRFKDIKYASDLDFTNQALDHSPRIRFFNSPIVYYNYMRPGSLTWEQKEAEDVDR